mgnify:CR=1 FL=1
MRNPKWTRDEILLTLDFYFKNYPNIPEKESNSIKILSDNLRRIQSIFNKDINSSLRNTDGVYMKLMNFHHINPEHSGKGLERVSRLDKEIFTEFIDKKDELSLISKKIISLINSSDQINQDIDIDIDNDFESHEGMILSRVHKFRERDQKIIRKKKEQILKLFGKLECEGCGFDFKIKYGSRGDGFIECHHIKPVSEIKENEKTKLIDLIILCSNCHRMVHRSKPWLSPEELKAIIRD